MLVSENTFVHLLACSWHPSPSGWKMLRVERGCLRHPDLSLEKGEGSVPSFQRWLVTYRTWSSGLNPPRCTSGLFKILNLKCLGVAWPGAAMPAWRVSTGCTEPVFSQDWRVVLCFCGFRAKREGIDTSGVLCSAFDTVHAPRVCEFLLQTGSCLFALTLMRYSHSFLCYASSNFQLFDTSNHFSLRGWDHMAGL